LGGVLQIIIFKTFKMDKIKQVLMLFVIIFGSCTSTKNLKNVISYSDTVVSVPALFAEGVVSTKESSEFNLTFTNDGKAVYFTRRVGNEKQKIYVSNFENKKWTTSKIATFSTDRDETPFITPDGKTLYFGSQRPIPNRQTKGNFDMNIWKTVWQNGKWCAPTPVSEIINQVQIEKEEWPSSNENSIYTRDGIDFYFATMLRGTKRIEIYQTKQMNGEFTKPVKIDGLFEDDKYWKSTPVISPDGNYLFFNAYGVLDGKGGEDIYVSKKTNNGWSKAKNVGELINTKAEEASARFSNDGKYFFFSREIKENPDKDGIWSIYYIETKYLQFETLFNN
jgi:WD40-like Beta Propeller Repeat